jgi:predicted pyridoxine 5'-phosphate oxidase superfamily flavin-nucleotide-binding protein
MRTIEEIRAEWREALKEHQEAVVQYEPFLATGTLTPGVNPVPIPYEDLKAAHDRLENANKWLDKIIAEFHEAVRAGQK